MLPLTLDIAPWPVLIVGRGAALERRVALVQQAGAVDMRVFDVGDNHQATASPTRFPTSEEIAHARLLLVAGLPRETARDLADTARRHRVLVNVEDMLELCDFHVPAMVRRGDLSIAISTAGGSPGLAAALRRAVEAQFDPSWEHHVSAAGELRMRMRAEGRTSADIARAMDQCAALWLRPESSPS